MRRALADERLRTSRLLARIRFVGISVAFLVNALLPLLFPEAVRYQSSFRVFVPYWLVAAGLYVAVRRWEHMTRLVGVDVALLDMPAAFLLQHSVSGGHGDAASAVLGITYFAMLTLGASFALDARRIVLAACMGAVLEAALLHAAEADRSFLVMSTLLMVGVAIGCLHLSARTVQLVQSATDEQRRRLRLGRYFSPQVVVRVECLADETAPGETRTVSVLFADLRGFTALSETLSSDRVVALLNDFLGRMVDAVFAHQGTLDKYLGDGLMAYFGAPVPAPDHAVRAVRCALDLHEALRRMNDERARRGEPPLRMGVGVHSGPAVVGNIGAPSRREYTAIGDTVNVAARMERLTKVHDVPVLMSDATRGLVADAFAVREVGLATIPGKRLALRCWTPLAGRVPPRLATAVPGG